MEKSIREFVNDHRKDMMKYLIELYEFQEHIKITYTIKKVEK